MVSCVRPGGPGLARGLQLLLVRNDRDHSNGRIRCKTDTIFHNQHSKEATKHPRVPYPSMGTGDPDLYKAFCWRFWQLTAAEGGPICVVMPRGTPAAKESTDFRLTMFSESEPIDITTLLNRADWVLDDAEHRYTIGLVCVAHGELVEKSIHIRGPRKCSDGCLQSWPHT